MSASFLLGLFGSLGHCVGMCSAVLILFDRQPVFQNKFAWFLAHAGRLTSYSLLGLILGAFGQVLWTFDKLQAALSFLFGVIAFYMASALIGLTPSLELLFSRWTPRWGRIIRSFSPASILSLYLLGVLWGFLPCGLVLTALLTAVASASAWQGALSMFVFGTATLPSLIAVKWLMRKSLTRTWSRGFASLVMMLFGFQFAMRGFASLGIVGHFMLGSIMFW
ncbi:MAG TPA: sulfite exporter TauE/SafE family protein [Anaerolineales bacterium]|nr:sulfite exporter TauE/SafE family protein [Anaerolineales bacterium]